MKMGEVLRKERFEDSSQRVVATVCLISQSPGANCNFYLAAPERLFVAPICYTKF